MIEYCCGTFEKWVEHGAIRPNTKESIRGDWLLNINTDYGKDWGYLHFCPFCGKKLFNPFIS